MPPPTSSGRSRSRAKPFPSGPSTWIASPHSSSQSAAVPGPIASMRKASSPRGARQRLIGRGSTRPGASSMKNCPGAPGSRPPRATRSSVYGPTCSFATTLSRSRLMLDSFLKLLQRERLFAAGVGNRIDRSRRTGQCRDARHARDEGGLADEISVGPRPGSLGGVDDEVAAASPDEVYDCRALAVFRHLAHAFHLEPCRGERVRGAGVGQQLEPELGEPTRHLDDRPLVCIAYREERRAVDG